MNIFSNYEVFKIFWEIEEVCSLLEKPLKKILGALRAHFKNILMET